VDRLKYATEIEVCDPAHDDDDGDGERDRPELSPMHHLLKLTIDLFPNVIVSFSHAFVNIQVICLALQHPDGEPVSGVDYNNPSNRKQHVLDLSHCHCLRELTIIDNCSHYTLTILGLSDITTLESAQLCLHDRDYSRLLENKPNLKTLNVLRASKERVTMLLLPKNHCHVPNLIELNGWDGKVDIPKTVRTLGLYVQDGDGDHAIYSRYHQHTHTRAHP